jgi:hypothetical protein
MNNYCKQCPKAKFCPIISRMNTSDSSYSWKRFRDGLFPEYGGQFNLSEIEAMKDCPFINPIVEKAIITIFHEEDTSDAASFLFTSIVDYIGCHMTTNKEKRHMQLQYQKKQNEFEQRAKLKLKAKTTMAKGYKEEFQVLSFLTIVSKYSIHPN